MKVQLLELMEALDHQKSSFILILVKWTQNCWVYVTMVIIVICLLIETKSLHLKLTIKMLTFQLNFVFEVFLMDLVLLSLEKYLWMEMFMKFSVDYNSIDTSDRLNIHKYLMTKNNIK